MISPKNFKKQSFLVYGLGSTGHSVINFLRKNNIKTIKSGTIIIETFIENLGLKI